VRSAEKKNVAKSSWREKDLKMCEKYQETKHKAFIKLYPAKGREKNLKRVTFEVLTAVKMPMLVFWVVTPCRLWTYTKVSEGHAASIFCPED
jgi:hypothetical protein